MPLGVEVFETTFPVIDSVGGEYEILLWLDMLHKHVALFFKEEYFVRIGRARRALCRVPGRPAHPLPLCRC